MTNDDATWRIPAGRTAWPRAFGIVLSCAVAALAVQSTTAAYAQMGENAITRNLTLTPDNETVQRFCNLGDACGDDSALSGNFGGVWRDGTVVEPGDRTFPGVRFIGKVLSAVESEGESENAFDVYCSTEDGDEACVKIETNGGASDEACPSGSEIIDVQPDSIDCSSSGFDYKLEYPKSDTTVLKTCKAEVSATCLTDDSALVTNGSLVAYRALFDYDCVRYCYGGCCRF